MSDPIILESFTLKVSQFNFFFFFFFSFNHSKPRLLEPKIWSPQGKRSKEKEGSAFFTFWHAGKIAENTLVH